MSDIHVRDLAAPAAHRLTILALDKRVLTIVACAVFAAAAALIVAHVVYTPLQVDGAWYGYPGYALSQGRDPGENFAPLRSLLDEESGTRVSFDFDTRNLRAYPLAAWFKVFGTSIWSVKAVSLLELALLLVVVALVLRGAVGAIPATIGILLVASDVAALALGATDLRPDLLVGVLGAALFGLTVAHRSAFSWQRFGAAVLLAFCLVFVHLTAAVAFSVIGGAMLMDFLLNRTAFDRTRFVTYGAVLATGAVGFLFDREIRGALIPTASDPSTLYYADFGVFDLARIANKEISRWFGYFSDTNLPLLVALAAVLVLMAMTFRAQLSAGRKLSVPLAFGVVCGSIVLAVLNPHRASSHAFSVVVLAAMLAAYALDAASADRRQRTVGLFLCLVLCAGAVAKLALTAKIVVEHEAAGFSNNVLLDGVREELTRRSAKVVVGPSKLWAYVEPDQGVLIVDIRSGDLRALGEVMDRVDLLLLDEEFRNFRFVDALRRDLPGVELELVGTIGGPSARDRLEVFAPVRYPER
jgi:hypothetical protein